MLVVQVGGDEVRRPARGGDLRDDRLAARRVASRDDDGGALGRECDRDRASDARRRSGDERAFAVHPHGRTLPAVPDVNHSIG